MKFFKKAILLFVLVCLTLGVGIFSACGTDNTTSSSTASSSSNQQSSSVDPEASITDDTNYRVGVVTMNGYGLKNVTVNLFGENNTLITSKRTGASGYVNFKEEDVELGKYTVGVDLPYGYQYAYDDVYKTTENKGMVIEIALFPKGLEAGSIAPQGTTYKLGDVMYDFTLTTTDNQSFTLSEVLKDKKMVMLNFWATWCGPCKVEFPAMSTAYTLYEEVVEIFAISTTDTKAGVEAFKAEQGLPFPMAHNQNGFEAMFPKSGIPLSVIVDRYGVISFWHNANMTATSDFTELFDIFVDDDYTPTVKGESKGDEVVGDGDSTEMTKPTVSAPSVSDVQSVLGNFAFRHQNDKNEPDEYSWPFLIGTDGDKQYLYASNRSVHNSYAQLFATFTLPAPTKDKVLVFDLKLWTEGDSTGGDNFYVVIDGVPVQTLYGQRNGGNWSECYAYVFNEYDAGEHEIAFIYQKDSGTSAGDDTVQIRNIRFVDLNEVDDQDIGFVFHYACEDELTGVAAEEQQFARYITPVFNEEDGYYHVNNENGPLLFANMLGTTPWSESSVWLLAYSDYVVEDGFNYHSAIESYAWEANNNLTHYGYTPVTKELRELLEITVRNVSIYNKWDGEYHENEWLETCIYYQHYGTTEALEDPMKTITFHAAEKLEEGTNTVRVQFAMNPRGFKYKFTPDQSGVYNFHSTGESDSEAWLVAENQTTFLGYWQDYMTVDASGKAVIEKNFNFDYYLEAGKTYYLLCTTFLDQAAIYDVVIEYVGESVTYWESAAPGDYSFNPATSEIFINDVVDYVYDAANDVYRVLNKDGSMGAKLYLNVNYMPRKWFASSINAVITSSANVATEDRALYIDGVDYTNEMKTYTTLAMRNTGKYKGFIEVNQALYELLYTITTSTKFDGIENSWLFLCYYEAVLGA